MFSSRSSSVIENETHNRLFRKEPRAISTSLTDGTAGMEILYHAREYPDPVLKMILDTGNLGIAIANWWKLGWPERVAKLLARTVYEDEFRYQLAQAQNILARIEDMGHFSPVQVIVMSGFRLEPPVAPRLLLVSAPS